MGLDFSMRTKAFINKLNTFVKEFRTELLIEEDGADEEEAWSLLTATMLSALFKTMSATQAETGDKPEDDLDLNSRAAKVFWGELGSATVLWRSYFRLVFASIRACSLH